VGPSTFRELCRPPMNVPAAPHSVQPVRLRISYRSPESLLQAFTKSVGKGGVSLPSQRPLERGTKFLFELTAESVSHPVEVLGEVVDVRRSTSGEYFLNIKYVPGRSRKGLDAALLKLFEAHRHEKSRRYPRVPVHLKALGTTQAWSVRDLSRGGAGVELESGELPRDARLGVPVLLELQLDSGRLMLHGATVWLTGGTSRPKTPPALGVEFGRLGLETLRALDRVLVLDGFPAGPWQAELTFGMDAVGRMP